MSGNVYAEIAKAIGRGVQSGGETLEKWGDMSRSGMNPEMENHYNALAKFQGMQMLLDQWQDMYAAGDRAAAIQEKMKSGALSAPIQKALEAAKLYGSTALKEIGPAATRTGLEQQFAPDLAHIDRMFAGRGISGGQTLQAKSQLLDKMVQQGYGAQQQGSMDYAMLMGQLEPMLRQQDYQTDIGMFYSDLGMENMLRQGLLGGMSSAIDTHPGVADVLGGVMKGIGSSMGNSGGGMGK